MYALLREDDARPAAEPDRLRQADFQRLARFIHEYSGIKMPPNKLTMIEMRLQRRLRALGIETIGEYCKHLFEQGGLQAEAVHLIDAVTTNKTDFFREPEHFRLLTEKIVPELLRSGQSDGSISIWSAACSTGAEPYTIAMVLDDLAQRLPFRYSILATDLCTEVLQTAVSGIYPAEVLKPVPAPLRQRYVKRSKDPAKALVRIAPELRSKLRFGRLNLIEPTYPAPQGLDVIFCRNVLIYFDKPTQEHVVRGLCRHLRPGGYLILGHSETVNGADFSLTPAGPSMFRRS
jgi:chemotaxis protein methyltransferase CheR